jgi:hypothetical protein
MVRAIVAAAAAALQLASPGGLAAQAAADDVLHVGQFSAAPAGASMPSGWQPLTFARIDRATNYELATDEGTRVVRATSERAASGLLRRIDIDPNVYPIVQWRWKIDRHIERSDMTRRAGDDYPARIYIAFDFDPARATRLDAARHRLARAIFGDDTPYRALSYIWEWKAPQGSAGPNAYTERTMMIVVRNGDDATGRWHTEERNVVEDYRKVFGTTPPNISGIALMTDTDDTGSSAGAWYGDIVFLKRTGGR